MVQTKNIGKYAASYSLDLFAELAFLVPPYPLPPVSLYPTPVPLYPAPLPLPLSLPEVASHTAVHSIGEIRRT